MVSVDEDDVVLVVVLTFEVSFIVESLPLVFFCELQPVITDPNTAAIAISFKMFLFM